MTLTYLSSTLSEEEYLEQRFKQAHGTGRVTKGAINNAKLYRGKRKAGEAKNSLDTMAKGMSSMSRERFAAMSKDTEFLKTGAYYPPLQALTIQINQFRLVNESIRENKRLTREERRVKLNELKRKKEKIIKSFVTQVEKRDPDINLFD